MPNPIRLSNLRVTTVENASPVSVWLEQEMERWIRRKTGQEWQVVVTISTRSAESEETPPWAGGECDT